MSLVTCSGEICATGLNRTARLDDPGLAEMCSVGTSSTPRLVSERSQLTTEDGREPKHIGIVTQITQDTQPVSNLGPRREMSHEVILDADRGARR